MVGNRRAEWLASIGLAPFLDEFPEFGCRPSGGDHLRIAGDLVRTFRAEGFPDIDGEFALELIVPRGFPAALPLAYERGGRIPRNYHTLSSGALCLSSPLRMAFDLSRSPTLMTVATKYLVPYLYRFSYWEKYGRDPWPELDHGVTGLISDYSQLLGAASPTMCLGFMELLGHRARDANKEPCPCGSGRRVGRCHNRHLNRLRDALPRALYRECYVHLADLMRVEERQQMGQVLSRRTVNAEFGS